MNSYRGGASITRMGRFIVVSGGNRFPAPLSSIEVLNTRKPEKWRTLSKLTLPNPTYDHCSVAINKTSMFVTGGFGQESQAIMLDLLNKNYKAEPSMRQPRRKVRLLINLLRNFYVLILTRFHMILKTCSDLSQYYESPYSPMYSSSLHNPILPHVQTFREYALTRPVVPGCAECAMAHSDFGRSVNPISPGGTDYANLITTGTPGFSDLLTALLAKGQLFLTSLSWPMYIVQSIPICTNLQGEEFFS